MKRYDFDQFAAVRNYFDLSFSPDGESVAYTTNASGQFNVWRQPVRTANDGTPLMPVQLTALVEDAARRAAWSPRGDHILTQVDHHGNENFGLYDIPAADGWLYPITHAPDSRHQLAAQPFTRDGRRILYGANERNPADFDALWRELDGDRVETLLAGDANYFPASWSPDGTFALVVKYNSNTDQDLLLCDMRSGEHRNLTEHAGEIKFTPGPWQPDGSGFYVLSDHGYEFKGLAFYDLKDTTLRWLENPSWEVEDVDVSHDGRYLAWLVNEDGYSCLYVRDTTTGRMRTFPQLPAGVSLTMAFSPAAPLLGIYINRPVQPTNLYMVDVESGDVRRLTQSFLGGIPEADMVAPDVIHYETADGRQIPAFLYRPREAVGGTRVPVVLSIHGGPEAQERPTYAYNGLYQYLVNHGIGVLAPNIRGSSGYGSPYQKLIHRDWGGAELRDLEHAALYLQSLDWVDPKRLGVFGGSFGGFATLSCVSRLPQYWAAAVDIVGPSNLITFARAVPPFWQRFMKQWVGDPDEDADMLRERSPITYVENIRAPLLVIQGANDPRVVKGESDQMVERLRSLGRTVEYMVFEDEGHGFTKSANMITAIRASAEWFERHLQ